MCKWFEKVVVDPVAHAVHVTDEELVQFVDLQLFLVVTVLEGLGAETVSFNPALGVLLRNTDCVIVDGFEALGMDEVMETSSDAFERGRWVVLAVVLGSLLSCC